MRHMISINSLKHGENQVRLHVPNAFQVLLKSCFLTANKSHKIPATRRVISG